MPQIKPHQATMVQARSILTPASGFMYGFTHTLNPYMGCAWGDSGCGVYCYVAESPIGLHAGTPWGQWLHAKSNAADLLRRELERAADHRSLSIFMSTATDPYQPAESRLRITRSVLEVFRALPVALLVIQTRSPSVERDFDLLATMPFAWLSMTVETDDDAVRRAMTPTCPSIERRLAAMRRARASGIRVQAAVSPVLPHDPDRFASRLEAAANRVVVDSFYGDGASGRRTARRPLPARFTELGYGDWRDATAGQALCELLQTRFKADRVGWSREGFNALARPASPPNHRYDE